VRPSRITHGRLSRVRPSSCARASSRATRRPSGEKTRRALCELERARAASRCVERRARGAHRAGKTAGPDWSASPRGCSSSVMTRFYTTRVSGVSFLCIGSPVIHDDGTRRRTMRDSRRSPRARWRSEKICGRARDRALDARSGRDGDASVRWCDGAGAMGASMRRMAIKMECSRFRPCSRRSGREAGSRKRWRSWRRRASRASRPRA